MRTASVAYLVPSLNYGGSETLLLSFLKYLDRKKFTPVVHSFYGRGKLVDEFRQSGVEVVEWCSPRRDPVTFFRMIAHLRRSRTDVVHTHLFDRQGRVAAYLAGVPVIVTTYHLVTDWDTNGSVSSRAAVGLDTLTSRLNDRIIAVSDDVKRYAVEKGRIERTRIETIENGIDVDRYRGAGGAEELRRQLGLEGKRVILSIGRLVEQKGHRYLIQSAEVLRENHPEMAVLIVGEGPLMENLEEEIEELRLTETVRMLGPRRDIPELLALSEVFVLPSLFEGLPITLLEAMASATPIVVTDVDGIRDVIEHEVDGLLVPSRDPESLAKAIDALLSDPERARELGRKSFEKARERYDIRHHVRKIEDLYMRLLEEKGAL